MTNFRDLESLKNFLKQDSKTVSLNPVRFINVDSLTMWVEVKKFLLSLADETMYLSGFCEGEDTTPNIKRISAALKKVKKSQFVSPMSEYLRIVPEQAESVIQKFIKGDYQNNEDGKLRIYFLMYRMKDLLRTIPTYDPRAKNCVILFETDEESDYRLTIIQKELGVNLPGNEIDGFRNYLKYWEANPDKPLILHTGNAIHFEKNHFFDDVHVIVTSYGLIKYQYGLPTGIFEELGSNDNWNSLVKVIINEGDFDKACCSTLSINKYSSSLFERWSSFNGFQKWLFWLWTRLQIGRSYEITAAGKCRSISDYLNELYCNIIDYLHRDKFEQFYMERKRILDLMHAVPTEGFWTKISSLNKTDALSCLTCLTDIERKTVFEIISDYDYKDRNVVLPILKRVYPQLYYYLQNDLQPNSAGLSPEHEQYFSEYKWLKATDNVSEGFMAKVRKIAMKKGGSVFQMKPRNQYVTEHYDEQTEILFVDGLGIEYVDYLAYLFSDLDEQEYSVTFEAGYCTPPSVTEHNKNFTNGRKTVEPPFRGLDELKHSNNVYPESIIKQLSTLDDLKDRVIGRLVGNTHRIIIASDHGSSRIAVKVRNTVYDNEYPKPDGTEIYKYGRFCEGTCDKPDYPTAINYGDYLIFADYSRFTQKGAPMDEIHGGASLEEWIVPVITIERYIGIKHERVEVKPLKYVFKPELGTKQVKVLFSISGEKRSNIFARVKGNTYKCEWAKGFYNFTFVPPKNDSKLKVKVIDGGILGEFEIEIEQGIKKNANFNI